MNNQFASKRIKSAILFMFPIIATVIVSCARHESPSKPTNTPLAIISSNPTSFQPSPTIANFPVPQVEPSKVSCDRKRFLFDTGKYLDYYWSNDGNQIYYTKDTQENDWFSYNLTNGKTEQVGMDAQETIYKLASQERLIAKMWKESSEPEWRGIYYSPSTKAAVFLKTVPGLGVTPTKGVGDQNLYQEIYLLTNEKSTPEFIGKVKGLVVDVYWTPTENKAILAMEEVMSYAQPSPYHLWELSVNEKVLTPRFERKQNALVNIKGISFDGDWVIYSYYGRNDFKVWIRNIFNDKEIDTGMPSSIMYI